MVQINLNSNIVSGIYSAIGVLMVILLTRFIQVIISCHNLHTIYDVRKPLRLKATRLSLLMDPGLAPRRLSRLLALLAILLTALITAGGFAFVGATEPVYQAVSVRNKVVRARRGEYVDFRKHISPDGRLASATFLLLSSQVCTDAGFKTAAWYVRTNDMDNLTDVKLPTSFQISNSTCVWEANSFKREIVERTPADPPTYRTLDCVNLLASEIIRQEQMTQIDVAAHNGSCPYHDVEVRCSNHSIVQCVGSMGVQDEVGGFALFYSFIGEEGAGTLIPAGRYQERDDAELLESMAFLAQFFPQPSLSTIRSIAISRVEENGSVQKLVGERNVTRVNIGLIMGAFGSALVLLVGVATVALVMWVRVVWLKGRRGYNSFSVNEDALACASQALRWGRDTDGGVRRLRRGVVVGDADGTCVTRNNADL